MADTIIKISKSGPYVVKGPARLLDHEGREYRVEAGKAFALCRCGRSSTRPFCDGTHSRCGFVSDETAG